MINDKDYFAKLEAIFFASGEPIASDKIADILEMTNKDAKELLDNFAAEYQKSERGIELVMLGDAYQLCTKREHNAVIKRALELKRNTPLSQAAMEVLAIIAYNQPVTKGFIEQVRGVDSSQTVNNLVDKGLVEEHGRLDMPGRPIAYKTTLDFLRCFGMHSLADLPSLPSDDGQVKLEEVIESELDKRG